ncbi:acyl-CoA synthetase (AMP-forming)/AMP-acid ligase II [Prescottella agglutinans]|uniref:Acyl-CoA synthetase (AMP-forming)/AMP-acid ligase II n=1 Tax=Prescottella agglutinans TaxID=1644129 RepID=A0ABT6MJG2_9NOCA|nr:acyl-CoA synthetase (AMP-forming)/AMP-acid ligase II [Prescottella agglutinans]
MSTNVTTEPRTTPAALWRAVEQFGSNEAVADGSDRTTYTELLERVRLAARALMAKGVEAGDRVAVWAPNTHHWIEAFLAAQYAGATLVPISTRYTGHEALDLLERTQAKVLVVPDRFLKNDRLADVLKAAGPGGIPTLQLVLRTPSDDPAAGAPTTEFPGGEILEWDQLAAAAEPVSADDADARARAVSPDDVADILFTSGTTGKSKGVMTAHRQTVGIADAWADCAEVDENDRYLVINPFFHTFGYKAGLMVCILRGATMVPAAVFDVPTIMATIANEKISVLPGAPTIHQTILDFPTRDDYDLSSLRVAITGAAAVPVVLVERMQAELGYDAVITAYGQTEAVVVTMCRMDDDPVTVSTSSGRAIPGMEVRIGEHGEILVRGENVMLGYLDDPEATKKTIDADGWLHTGDVGVLDERGYLDITDRLKDMYISGGFNVYPAEIENALARMDSLAEAAVIGIPDERMGEVGRAYVVPKAGATVTEEEVVAFCKERLANFKIPREVKIVGALPRNPSGKVLKNDLREGKA